MNVKSIAQTLANNTVTVHSLAAKDGFGKALQVMGYIPVVGLIPAALRIAAVGITAFKCLSGGKINNEKVSLKKLAHTTILQLPRALFEASGLGILLLPADFVVTVVHAVARAIGNRQVVHDTVDFSDRRSSFDKVISPAAGSDQPYDADYFSGLESE